MKTLILIVSASAAMAADMPRPEYPQPQFQREQWQSLNGTWEFEFDDTDRGLRENWASGERKLSKSILVPFCFESAKSGIGDTSFHPVVWYRRQVEIPAGWQGKRVLLHFGAVDYRATVWVNGRLLGSHQGGNVPFRFDVTDHLLAAANTVVLRAEDPPTDRYIPRGKQYWEPQSRGIFYTRTTGIWQPVWMETTGDSYLERVRITPANDGSVRFSARVARPRRGAMVHAQVTFAGRPIATAAAQADGVRATVSASVDDPRLWFINQPNLYDVTLELRQGDEVLDKVQSYFGFRTVGVENGRVVLNGRPIYPKFVLDQGYWPESTLTPPSDDAIRFDIKATQDMGFNGARKHQKVEDPRFLYWADKMGFLVSSEIANAYLYDEEYAAAFTREWMEAVERDYNHPSIIMWVPINESWGTPNLRDAAQQNHLKALYALTKSLDPTRLVIDNDGWEHTDTTDLMAIHDYAKSGEGLYEKYKSLGNRGAAVPDNARVAMLPGYRYNGSPIYLSEFGGIAYIPEGHQVPKESWGYSGVEKSREGALRRLEGLYQAIAKIPAIAGICYTQLTDVEQEVNGLLTYDRKTKFDAAAIRRLNELLR